MFENSISDLSGGQKQILNLASVMAMQPSVLILDEPTSQLDPIAASDFINALSKINREFGTTIIITEHRLENIFSISTKVLAMDKGKIVADTIPEKIADADKIKNNNSLLASLPAPIFIWNKIADYNSVCPITIADGRNWLKNFSLSHKLFQLEPEFYNSELSEIAVELKDIWFRYSKNSKDVLKGLTLKVYKGEFLTVLGGNGTGKSTLLSIINGLNKPYRGKIKTFTETCDFASTIAALPQNPQTLFIKNTVISDLLDVFEGTKIPEITKEERLNRIIKLCKLDKLLNRHPYDLSGGEQQRAALAKLLLLNPQILLLDEPTKAIDAEFKIEFANIIKHLTRSGVTVIMVSHDLEFCAEYAHRCVMIFNGEVVCTGTPRSFFSSNSFYVTSASVMSRNIIEKAITVNDIIYCCTGKKEEKCDENFYNYDFDYKNYNYHLTEKRNKISKTPLWKKIITAISVITLVTGIAINLDLFNFLSLIDYPVWINYAVICIPIIALFFLFCIDISVFNKDNKINNYKPSKKAIIMCAFIFMIIPLTIILGIILFNNEKYMFISLLVIIECILPFFLIFESKQPKTERIVLISVLCALTILSRMIFSMLPQFKPVIAFVIISSVAFGGETGFLVGAISMLVSNMMFGQGAWTPWQMFATGLIGYFAGFLFNNGILIKSRLSICVYGFFSTILIYGGIMNFYSAVSSHSTLNINMVSAFYIQGLPLDIIYAISSVVFIFLTEKPILEKFERIKIKYGL